MAWKLISEAVDRVMRLRRHMIERPPVIGDEIPCLQAIKQRQRVGRRQMALSEAGKLPAGSVPDRKERHVELSAFRRNVLIDHACTLRRQGGVASKETGDGFRIK